MLENEIWKPVENYEGIYEVSNLGRVRSLERYVQNHGVLELRKGRILKPGISGNGYNYICLSKNGNRKWCGVHRLVAQAFIPNPNNLPVINHRNEVKTDNRIENLEWCTYKYNNEYSGNIEKWINSNKKKIIQLTKNGEFVAEYESAREAERITGIEHSNISGCCLKKYGFKSAGNYKWKFKLDYEQERANS